MITQIEMTLTKLFFFSFEEKISLSVRILVTEWSGSTVEKEKIAQLAQKSRLLRMSLLKCLKRFYNFRIVWFFLLQDNGILMLTSGLKARCNLL